MTRLDTVIFSFLINRAASPHIFKTRQRPRATSRTEGYRRIALRRSSSLKVSPTLLPSSSTVTSKAGNAGRLSAASWLARLAGSAKIPSKPWNLTSSVASSCRNFRYRLCDTMRTIWLHIMCLARSAPAVSSWQICVRSAEELSITTWARSASSPRNTSASPRARFSRFLDGAMSRSSISKICFRRGAPCCTSTRSSRGVLIDVRLVAALNSSGTCSGSLDWPVTR